MPTPVPLADLFAPADWLALLNVSLTGIQLLRPVYAPDGPAIVDFTLEYTNPTGLRMVGFSEPPSGTLLHHFPATLAAGVFAYYQRAFATSEPLTYEANYQADGVDNYFRFSAQRSGERLLVNFTDTSDQDRNAVEEALRESQAAERAARAEAEQRQGELEIRVQERTREALALHAELLAAAQRQVREREEFYNVFEQAPVMVALLRRPEHFWHYCNPAFQELFPGRALTGQRYAEAMPEVVAIGLMPELDRVYATGQPYYGAALPGVTTPPDVSPPTCTTTISSTSPTAKTGALWAPPFLATTSRRRYWPGTSAKRSRASCNVCSSRRPWPSASSAAPPTCWSW
ncbi:hypothetical protein GCM10027422_34790 [Hymenobacter arcticus]